MISYIIVLLLVSLFAWLAERSRTPRILENGDVEYQKTIYTACFFAVSALLLTCMAGFRYRVGTDYKSYYAFYDIYKNFSFKEDFDILEEPLIVLISKVASIIYDSPYTMFFLTSVVTVGFALYSIYGETEDFAFVILLYVFVGCWHSSFNGMRQCLAVAIVFLGRRYITDRKLLKYLLVCFVAFLAHRSAMVCVLFYFIYSKRFSVRRLIVVLIATLIISFNYETAFGFIGWLNNSEFIANEYTATSVSALRTLVAICPAVVGVYYAITRKLDKQQIFYVYMMVINAAIRIATSDSAYLYRLGMFPAIFLPLGLSAITRSCDPKYRKIFRIGIVSFFLLYWLYEITSSVTLFEFEWIFGRI